MTIYYVDSSALVKRYVTETGSDWIQGICDPAAGHVIVLAHIGLVECDPLYAIASMAQF